MKSRWIQAMVPIAFLLVFGCADKETKMAKSRIELMERAGQYNECFYWRDYDKASYYVLPEMKPDFLAFAQGLRHRYTLENYQIMDIQMSPTGERAAVITMRSFIMSPSPTLRSQEFAQEWVLKNGVWYITGPPY